MMRAPNNRSKSGFGRLVLIGFIGIAFTGCSYRFGFEEFPSEYKTISVPYIQGDPKGELTGEIIKTLSLSGAFSYSSDQGDLTLRVKFVELDDENIGFRYDRNTRGKLKKSIVPTESRMKAIVEVTLIDSTTGQVLRGPTLIDSTADFDHSFYSSRNRVNIFSLGQVNDIDAARDAAMQPLNCLLAEKIVDYILNSR